MKDIKNSSNSPKSKTCAVFEIILLIICLAVTALRLTITEGPWPQSSDEIISQEPAVYGLLLSAALIMSFIAWVVYRFLSGRFVYRFNWIEAGIVILIIASVISGFSASNLRAAITNTTILIAPLLMTVLLIQILDSRLKILLALAVIAAGAFLCAYQCSEQFFDMNKKLIEQYEQNPTQMLSILGIEPGSLEHFQFEHRLYSKDIKGFFTTGNSAGSFLILALFAAAILLIENIQKRKEPKADPRQIIAGILCTAAIAAGLLSTHSKGAIVSVIISSVIFASLYFYGNLFDKHKKTIFIICILLVAAVVYGTVSYGLSKDSLPGGKSMLTRWYYWRAAAKVFAEHPWTGVGAGNFGMAYLHYKLPETIETVNDPHNFVLSILTQFGPLGLAGLAVILLLPLSKISFAPISIINSKQSARQMADESAGQTADKQGRKGLKMLLVIIIPIVFLIFRPIVTPLPPDATEQEIAAAAIMLFIIPAAVFAIGFLLATAGINLPAEGKKNIIAAALASAVLGVLIHNTIDFALFEPPVLTAFCAVFACLIANDLNQKQKSPINIKAGTAIKLTSLLAGLVITAGFFYYCIIPVVQNISKIQLAKKALLKGQFEDAENFLSEASEDDRLSSFAPVVKGSMLTQRYLSQQNSPPELLLKAEKSYLEATKRDKQNYKNQERLSGIYALLSQASTEPQRTEYLNKTFAAESKASELYPGLDRLYFSLGDVAEQLGKRETAIENYKKAIEIEDAFRAHFKKMYPQREVVSRLGEQKYNIAKQKTATADKQEGKN
jgi:hypothetical protein